MQARRDLRWRRSSSNHVLTRVAFASVARLRKADGTQPAMGSTALARTLRHQHVQHSSSTSLMGFRHYPGRWDSDRRLASRVDLRSRLRLGLDFRGPTRAYFFCVSTQRSHKLPATE
ncbi:hypothetical protein PHSY_002309 [Pseudozyma hubeiensis SY62]|uniref:Uncharacterized protein n=1 Tax=Pseudozyma hubeiensis (strain SY62) TaxID=1305764 RepID=R9P0Q0_PSEHS|nr:hypothetical protein PHSY_002309 [Pseudozyma hubeiensis SY62]GAC94736.1 hypothetical protein PHSY_002309 [Pseudozyma hubeiensis SY62]